MIRTREKPGRGGRAAALRGTLLAVLVAVMLAPGAAQAFRILYEATDLPDEVEGEDLWEYTYTVEEFEWGPDYGFGIWFDYDRFDALEAGDSLPGDDWDVVILQPDLILASDGLYDAMALVEDPQEGDVFSVRFVHLGPHTPRSQPAFVYDLDFEDVHAVEFTPEPGSPLLQLAALVVVSRIRRSRRPTQTRASPVKTDV